MKKSILLFLSVWLTFVIGYSQQLPIFSQYQEGDHFTNPALLSNGIVKYETNSAASLIFRNQWTGVKDAPRTALGRFEHWNEDANFLYGGSLIYDQTGPTSFIGLFGKAGYGINFSKDWMLSVALSGGLVQYRIKAGELNFLEAGDIAQNNATRLYPDVGVGAVLYYDKKYYVGVSMPQAIGLGTNFTNSENDFNIQRVRHYYATAGGLFPLREDWIELSFYSRYVINAPLLIGANFRYDYKNIFWIGAGGSNTGALSMEGGLIFTLGDYGEPLRVGYGITNYFSEFNLNFGLVHELKAVYSW